MKTELNKENKAKFFALYWGQRVKIVVRKDGEWELRVGEDVPGFNSSTITQYLELKPLSQITDKDAIEVLNILMGTEDSMYSDWHPNIQKNWLKIIKQDLLDDFGSRQAGMLPYFKSTWFTGDYLRSKGYALPYMGLSVEQMVKAGWLQLNTNPSKL